MKTHEQVLDTVSDRVLEVLTSIEEKVVLNYSLADAVREGSSVSEQQLAGWSGGEDQVCALSAAEAAVRARAKLNR